MNGKECRVLHAFNCRVKPNRIEGKQPHDLQAFDDETSRRKQQQSAAPNIRSVTLWDKTKEYSGITEEYFYEYFENREQGFAIKIKNKKRFENPKCLKTDYNLTPPQSFAYWSIE